MSDLDLNTYTKRVFLWKVARTRSTVLQKCMTFVDGCQIWMEPYCQAYYNETRSSAKGETADFVRENLQRIEEVKIKEPKMWKMNPAQDFTYKWVQQELEKDVPGKIIIFINECVSGMFKEKFRFLPKIPCHHTFLIREPTAMYVSLKKGFIEEFTQGVKWNDYDLGTHHAIFGILNYYPNLYEIWKYVKDNFDPKPIVIDSDDLASQPEVVLSRYFSRIGIPFKPSYLKWERGRDTITKEWRGCYENFIRYKDGIFYKRALDSDCFVPPGNKIIEPDKITPDIQSVVAAASPLYQEMVAEKI